MQARSKFSPRAYPHLTSLRSLMPPEMLDNINGRDENGYGPPDVWIPLLDPPPRDIDILSIVERSSDYAPIVAPTAFVFCHDEQAQQESAHPYCRYDREMVFFVGESRGIDFAMAATLDSFCSRGPAQTCLFMTRS